MDLSRNVELARRLRAARALSGKEVREIASEIGLSPRAYYRLESAVRVPTVLELEDIAAATGVAIEFFFGDASSEGAAEAGTVTPSPTAVKQARSTRSRAPRRRLKEGARQ